MILNLFNSLFISIHEEEWLLWVPIFAVSVFAVVLQLLLTRTAPGARRHALMFGIGVIAVLASIVFGMFFYTFIRVSLRGNWAPFDLQWILGAIGSAALTVWLWFALRRVVKRK
jgi:hypothetical protein